MRVVVSTCWDEAYKPLALIADPILRRYCTKRGYGYEPFAYHESPKALDSFGDRGKIAQYMKLYATGRYDAMMFLDIDALVMNSEVRVEDVLQSAPFVWSYDVNGPCSGFWIARRASLAVSSGSPVTATRIASFGCSSVAIWLSSRSGFI